MKDSNRILKSAFSAIVLLGAVTACTPQAQQSPAITADTGIIGGAHVEATDVISKTTMAIVGGVRFEDKSDSQFICTGSLISKDVILTAGHCVPKVGDMMGDKKIVQVALVAYFKRDLTEAVKSDVRPIIAAIVHPDYGQANEKGQDNHDLALVKFAGTVPAGYEIAQYLQDETLLTPESIVTLAGYGINKTDGVNTESDNTLAKVDVQIYQSFGQHEMILDQTEGKGACHGDSGGPAFIKVNGVDVLWGVTSRGLGKDGKDDCSLIAIYTKIKSEQSFVDSALATLAKKQVPPALRDGFIDGDGI